MSLAIRSARDWSATALAATHAQCFARGWSADEIDALLMLPNVIAFATGDQELTGFILTRVQADEAEIVTLAVAPASRRQGAGRALTAQSMAAARAVGAATMFLEVEAGNTAARGLYESLGFEEAGVRRGYYTTPEGPRDARVMRANLS
ncbi:MAG: ribosomal protein S18-alanine N-acetyltransferase [Hyphomonadaceae bacterium]